MWAPLTLFLVGVFIMSEFLRLDEIIDQLKDFAEGYNFTDKFEVINNWETSFTVMIPRTKRRDVHKDQTALRPPSIWFKHQNHIDDEDEQYDKDVRQGALRRH